MSHGLPGFDFDSSDYERPLFKSRINKFIIAAVIIGGACLGIAINAIAKPSDWQTVSYEIVGKPKSAIQMNFKTTVKRGSLSELPFSTLMTNIVFPRQIRTNLAVFPKCDQLTILNSPDQCPSESLVAEGTASSLLRPRNNTSGIIISNPKLSLKMYVSAKNKVYVRVWSQLSNRVIIPGLIRKSRDKKYSEVMTLTLPRGTSSPVPGMISQIEEINLVVKGNYKGNSALTLSSCPRNRKLNFSYWAAYNINGDKVDIGENQDVLTSEGLIISQVSPPFKRTVSCSK